MEKIKFSIRYKISIYIAILLMITGGLLYLYILFSGKNMLLEQLELRYVELGNSLINTCRPYILKEDLNSLKSVSRETLKRKGITTIYIYSSINNYPLIKMYKTGKKEVAWVNDPIKNIYYDKNITLRRGVDYSQVNINIATKEKELAMIKIIYSNQEANQKIDEFSNNVVFIFLIVLGVGLIGVIILSNFIVNPITKMAEEVSLVGKGDLNREIKVKTRDEIELLAENFNQMVVDLRKSRKVIEDHRKNLEKKVEERTRDLQEAHERIVQSEKMAALGQLASSVSHELRNPLGAIKLVTYYLKSKIAKSNPDLIKHIEDIENSLNSAQRIVSNILSFSRLSDLTISEININEVIEKILKTEINKRLFKKVEIKKELKADIPLIKADKDQIIQVIENLLINAVQSISGKGEVVVGSSLEEKDGKKVVRLDIKDNGCGISKRIIEKLFQPFFTVKAKGIGLGLVISKNIINKHGGRILVNSEVGQGTTFSVLLPIDKEDWS
ncbi:MAG: ATP-binding protein [bacterium]|nr:ATP-binding protein [bacterium]